MANENDCNWCGRGVGEAVLVLDDMGRKHCDEECLKLSEEHAAEVAALAASAARRIAEALAREPLLRWFSYSHLPEALQRFSKPFSDLAHLLCDILPANPQRTIMLNKLVEAKDCAVRSNLQGEMARPAVALAPLHPSQLTPEFIRALAEEFERLQRVEPGIL